MTAPLLPNERDSDELLRENVWSSVLSKPIVGGDVELTDRIMFLIKADRALHTQQEKLNTLVQLKVDYMRHLLEAPVDEVMRVTEFIDRQMLLVAELTPHKEKTE